MKIRGIASIVLFFLAVIMGVLAMIISGGEIFAIIGGAAFVAAVALLIFRKNSVIRTLFCVVLYMNIILDFLFHRAIRRAVILDVVLLFIYGVCFFSVNAINKRKSAL
ncbi:MAG: hypothetical protein K6G65_10375 [Lachnospiraceae bacterium]|nr:hypothetical protein [Lachnospiraceae bacterium]